MNDLRSRRQSLRGDERGMALALALFAIVIIGALIAGAAYAGRMEMGGGRGAMAATQALEQAETGLTDIFANWDPTWNSQVPNNPPTTVTVNTVTAGNNSYTTTLTRLGGDLFFVGSTGQRIAGTTVLASRSLGQIAKLDIPDVTVNAAVEGMGDVNVGGTSTVSGINTNPAGWDACTGPLVDVPGVRASNDVNITNNAVVNGAGTPPYVENDSTVQASRFNDLYNLLLPSVTLTLSGGTYNNMWPDTTLVDPGSVCRRANTNNWGEPGDSGYLPVITKCRSYMPVILFTGNTQINTGKGQGVILVQGDINFQGTFIFDGIILATGNIDFHGSGAANSRIYGALFSANSTRINDDISIIGAPVITYSSCAVQAALRMAGRAVPIPRRSWVQVVN
jgi:hypothetical protein